MTQRNHAMSVSERSDWRGSREAMEYFGFGRSALVRVASDANARRKVGKLCLYNVRKIEEYLDSQLDQ